MPDARLTLFSKPGGIGKIACDRASPAREGKNSVGKSSKMEGAAFATRRIRRKLGSTRRKPTSAGATRGAGQAISARLTENRALELATAGCGPPGPSVKFTRRYGEGQSVSVEGAKGARCMEGKQSQSNEEFAAFIRDAAVVFEQLRTVLPKHEMEKLNGKLHPGAIESTCNVVLQVAELVEEYWAAHRESLSQEAPSRTRNSKRAPQRPGQTSSSADSTAKVRRSLRHRLVPKRKLSSERMTKEQWLKKRWPAQLKNARGADPQKIAADRCRVSVETYKKWEQGASLGRRHRKI